MSEVVDFLTPQQRAEADWAPNAGPQANFMACSAREALYGGAAGGGKGLDVTTPIPTPAGWSRMGDLRIGDKVFAPDGTATEITFVSEVKTIPCFKVEFSDGAAIVCDEEHRWHVFTDGDRLADAKSDPAWRARRRANRPTRGTGKRPDLASRNALAGGAAIPRRPGRVLGMDDLITHHEFEDRPLSIRVAESLKTEAAALPVDPYVLGAWLGDGTLAAGSFTLGEQGMIDLIAARIAIRRQPSMPFGWCAPGLAGKLRELGLRRNKHVPPAYLRASPAQRLELLRGLMDTDGHACESGAVEFVNMRSELADGVRELAVSLGWRATITTGRAMLRGKDCGTKYRVKWTPSDYVFNLARKRERQTFGSIRTRWRYIEAIRPVPTVPTVCVAVDHPSRCYLAGRSMIPTHNTDALIMGAITHRESPFMRSILFRKTFPMLSKIIARSRELYPMFGARFNETKNMWRFPAGGYVRFGQLDKNKDCDKYQGDDFTYIGFDELTQWGTDYAWVYMSSRLRTAKGSGITLLEQRGATNPGGRGHHWVKERFKIDDAGNATEFVVPETGFRRVFQPARLKDNPFLDDAYKRQLASLPPDLRKALMEGRWDIIAGAMFENWSPRDWTDPVDGGGNVCDPFELPAGCDMWRGGDDGFNAPACVLWFVRIDGRVFVVDELYRAGYTPQGLAEAVRKKDGELGRSDMTGILDSAAFADIGMGNSQGEGRGQIMNALGCRWTPCEKPPGSRVAGVSLVYSAIGGPSDKPLRLKDGRRPLIVFRRCKNLIRTLPALPKDETDPEDVDTEGEDHAYDALRYGLQYRRREISIRKLSGT